MIRANPGNDFASWRAAAKDLLAHCVAPDEVWWETSEDLFGDTSAAAPAKAGTIRVPAEFLPLAREAACFDDPARWAILYRILWRLTLGGERHLLSIASDPDMAKARRMQKSVRREIHKMHAFVRFRLVDAGQERETYAAWFEPDHFIVEAATPFFRDRFASMDWSIFTPKGNAHWNGRELTFTPGIPRNPVAEADPLEHAWRTYYRNIFNPARVKVKAMQAEMAKRYWKNLPEAELIDGLIGESRTRVRDMIAEPLRPAKPLTGHPYLEKLQTMSAGGCIYPPPPGTSLEELGKLSANCRACPLWEHATGTVFGEGPADARLMIVGEQPGDREDVAGRVFVGPAGKLLDRALADAGIARETAYLTNAVKHFKWRPAPGYRQHRNPDATEIDACRPWVLSELKNVSPETLVLLGSTAAQSLLGKKLAVTQERGLYPAPHLAPRVVLTVHPSFLLRLPDPLRKEAEYARFVEDLKLAIG